MEATTALPRSFHELDEELQDKVLTELETALEKSGAKPEYTYEFYNQNNGVYLMIMLGAPGAA